MVTLPSSFPSFPLETFVGFDDFLKKLETVTAAAKRSTYPPYNVRKISDNKYVIEIAVAGFGKQDIEILLENDTLTVSGNLKSEETSNYLFQGIAQRPFTRTFAVADTIEIKNAELVNGMLKIWLENIIPESKKPKKIDIGESSSTNKVEKDTSK